MSKSSNKLKVELFKEWHNDELVQKASKRFKYKCKLWIYR